MNVPARLAIAAIAIVVVAAVAAIKLLPPNSVGGNPSPSPTTSAVQIGLPDLDRPLAKGARYRVGSPFAAPFTIAFPSAWTPKALAGSDVEFVSALPANAATWVTLDLIDGVVIDPCHGTGQALKSPDLPMTVDGVVQAVTRMSGFTAGSATDITIGGVSGKTLVLTNAINTDTAGCTFGPMLPLFSWPGSGSGGGTNGGSTERLWVLDVHGRILVIDGESFGPSAPAAIAEIKPIVASIVFE
ncbi:MAG: hypothetical protein HY264_11540 [Chloroflexi bacterium]|nr:hypothetical protein [Chloroflexota bacterium]